MDSMDFDMVVLGSADVSMVRTYALEAKFKNVKNATSMTPPITATGVNHLKGKGREIL